MHVFLEREGMVEVAPVFIRWHLYSPPLSNGNRLLGALTKEGELEERGTHIKQHISPSCTFKTFMYTFSRLKYHSIIEYTTGTGTQNKYN